MKSPLSLKMRAITLLSQREHSSSELRRKLMRIGAEMAKAAALAAAGQGPVGDQTASRGNEPEELEAQVETLLAWLAAQGYLSETRFVESRIHARASRYGSLRIKQELAQHGLALSAEKQAELRASEAERARSVWQRKFGGREGVEDPAQRAKEIRFLTARGFSSDIVRRVLRGAFED